MNARTDSPFAELALRHARERPDAVALITVPDDEPCTYGGLGEAVERSGRSIDAVAGAGEPVALLTGADQTSVAMLLAALARDAPTVLLPISLPPEEIRQVLTGVGVRLLWSPQPPGFLARLPGVPAARPGWRELRSDVSIPHQMRGSRLCQLTSGSMGPSRLAVRSLSGVREEIAAVAGRLGSTPDDRVLCTSSIAHSYALIGGLLTSLWAGATVALTASGQDFLRVALPLRPTIVFGLAMTYGLTWHDDRSGDALAAARYLFSAGAPLLDGLFDRFRDRFGLPIRQDYGTTETGTISLDTAEDGAAGRAGHPLPHLQVRLAPPAGIPLREGEAGEVQVRGTAVAGGYWENGAYTPAVNGEGWYATRDAGRFDADGNLRLGRRLRDPIQRAGRTIWPEEVENALRGMAGVDEVAVVAHGKQVRAVVVAPGIQIEQVAAWCREHLEPAAVPDELELRDALPRSPAGKILTKYMI